MDGQNKGGRPPKREGEKFVAVSFSLHPRDKARVQRIAVISRMIPGLELRPEDIAEANLSGACRSIILSMLNRLEAEMHLGPIRTPKDVASYEAERRKEPHEAPPDSFLMTDL